MHIYLHMCIYRIMCAPTEQCVPLQTQHSQIILIIGELKVGLVSHLFFTYFLLLDIPRGLGL